MSEQNERKPLLGGFKGFTIIDEPPEAALPERWWTWGLSGATRAGAVGTLLAIVSVIFETDSISISNITASLCVLTCVGFLIGANWGWAADRIMRERDEIELEEHKRTSEEDRQWMYRLSQYEEKNNGLE